MAARDDAIRRVIGPAVTLVTRDAARLERMRVCAAWLLATAGPASGKSIWWGYVVHGELVRGVDSILFAVRIDHARLGWQLAWAAARMLEEPILTWQTWSFHGPGSWTLEARESEGCTVIEPPALYLERMARLGLLT